MNRNVPTAILLLFSAALAPSLSQAAVFNVTNETELQQALNDASVSAEDDVINIAAGQYSTSNNGGNPFTYLVNFKTPAAGSLTISGQGAAQTLLDGANASEILDLQDYASTGAVLVQDIGFQHANAPKAVAGGLGVNLGSSSNMSLTVQNCTFNQNIGVDAGGAALSNYNGPITFHNNLVTGNHSDLVDGSGGAFFAANSANTLLVTNSIFYNNTTAGFGGAFSIAGADNQVSTLTNNTIFGNQSDQVGGGIAIGQNPGAVANAYNNIIFGNTSAGDPNNADIYSLNPAGTTLNFFNNDFNTINNSGGATLNEANNLHVDPALIDPPGGNFNLSAGSPVIDQGDPAAPSMPTTDYAGNPRPAVAGTNPDMGAIEFQPSPTPTATPIPPIPVIEGGGCSLGSQAKPGYASWAGIAGIALTGLALGRRRHG